LAGPRRQKQPSCDPHSDFRQRRAILRAPSETTQFGFSDCANYELPHYIVVTPTDGMDPTPPTADDIPYRTSSFHTTHWATVFAARENAGVAADEALGRLCSTYWSPLYAFILRQGSTPHEAEDLTQEFFHRFLERNRLENVRPAAGKFRSFLLACVKNFLANERERSNAQRRGGGKRVVSLNGTEAAKCGSLELADHLTPEAEFERRWAFALLEQTMSELRGEQSTDEKRRQFEELQGFLPGGDQNTSRAELAARRGVSLGAIDVAVHRLRQRFGALLREQVAQTVSSEAEVDDEIRYLISALGRK
jgi:DNA-directed RNA polymerase specialized sigma24 family protein